MLQADKFEVSAVEIDFVVSRLRQPFAHRLHQAVCEVWNYLVCASSTRAEQRASGRLRGRPFSKTGQQRSAADPETR
jgi:hypothetical protein